MSNRVPMTREAYNNLEDRLRHLKNEKRPKIEDSLATARDHGDLSENSEFDAAVEELGRCDMEISEVETKLALADIVDTSKVDKSGIYLSAKVTVKNLDDNDEEFFEIVSDGETGGSLERISINSPLAAGLLGKQIGDIAECEVPSGTLRFEILKIEY